MTDAIAIDSGDAPETALPIGAGRVRGLHLHKLMEEVLTGELREDVAAFSKRVRTLTQELAVDTGDAARLPEADEIAATAWRTLQLPDIAALRPRLVPELPVHGVLSSEGKLMALAGRVDAIALDGERAAVVLDWKSDSAHRRRDSNPRCSPGS